MQTISAAFVLFLIPVLKAQFIDQNVFINVSEVSKFEELFDIKGFVNGYGYPFESHEVTTEDGYVLGVHRIPHGKNELLTGEEVERKPAVLVMHGLLSNSLDFLILGPAQSLAMLLADMGYDVWLGNNRGNTWSRKHVSLDPNTDSAFWDFSFHELGNYDDTAMIDYILNATGQEKIFYIGHSQGTTQFFALASTKPEYNEKIILMSALAPVVFVEHMVNPIFQWLSGIYNSFEGITDYFHIGELLPHIPELTSIFEKVCDKDSGFQDLCLQIVFFIGGYDIDEVDRTTFPKIFESVPAGASVKDLKHYLQEINSGHFRPYDYGNENNLEIYGNVIPPDYDLGSVTAPIALHYAENDWFAALNDVDRLISALPNVVENHLLEFKKFSHLDFLLAKDVIDLCYLDVIKVMNKYLNKN